MIIGRRSPDFDRKRRLVLRTAAQLFAERGAERASLALVAHRLGVSRAFVQTYFVEKEDLLFAVMDDHLATLLDVVERATAAPAAPRDRLVACARAYLELAIGADAHRVLLRSTKLLPAERRDDLRTRGRWLLLLFTDAMTAAIPRRAVRARLAAPLALSLLAMLNGAPEWFREGRALRLTDYAALAVDAILAGGHGRRAPRLRLPATDQAAAVSP